MIYTEKSCKKFIEAAASKEPVPGGGSVAALAGALGTSLGHMVGALTVGKKKYADVEDEMMELMKEGRQLQCELLDLVQADIDMFEPLSQLYSLKPETDEEIAEKERLMEEALENASAMVVFPTPGMSSINTFPFASTASRIFAIKTSFPTTAFLTSAMMRFICCTYSCGFVCINCLLFLRQPVEIADCVFFWYLL